MLMMNSSWKKDEWIIIIKCANPNDKRENKGKKFRLKNKRKETKTAHRSVIGCGGKKVLKLSQWIKWLWLELTRLDLIWIVNWFDKQKSLQ